MFINEKISILYGSQGGNGQDVAERIWRDSKRYHFNSFIKCMDDYNVADLISESCIIFVCSTTGQGEEPDNMKLFWKFLLKKTLPPNCLEHLKHAVLGLGDSSYTKFNFVAKRLHKRLLQLGSEPLIPLGLGDDQHDLGYDVITDPWIENLWKELLLFYPLPNGVTPLPKNTKILPRWNVTTSRVNNIKTNQSIYYSTRKPTDFQVTVLENTRITHPDHFQDVRLIKLNAKAQQYSPGDVIALKPKNLSWQVDIFLEILRENHTFEETSFTLNQNDENIPVPKELRQDLSFRQLCEEYFDLMAIPRRYTFNILSQITDSELEREKCEEFNSAEGQQELYTYCNRPRRNIVEVLQDFPHATKNLTLELLFEIFPPIKAREFSIASSAKQHTDQIHILLAVVEYKTKLVKNRFGLCSNYLAQLKEGDEVTAWLKKGSFIFPPKNIPVIMVGPGTGVAPFRNFIFDRVKENEASSQNLLLFFGCRKPDRDFHCKEEFLQLQNDNKLSFILAFSQLEENKIYVQDKIMENKVLVWDFLSRNGQIFIAGNAKLMPQQVREAFISVCEISGGMDKEAAHKFIELMEKQNRYQTECWS